MRGGVKCDIVATPGSYFRTNISGEGLAFAVLKLACGDQDDIDEPPNANPAGGDELQKRRKGYIPNKTGRTPNPPKKIDKINAVVFFFWFMIMLLGSSVL